MSAISLDKPRIHQVLTPEGVSLPFVVAPAGDRAAAFLFDMLLIVLGTVAVWALAALSAMAGLWGLGVSFAIVVGFLLWNFYFIYFEVHRGGTTFGKRRMGLRVISRDGGPLTAEAIFARNLMRNLELNLPAVALLAPEQMLPEAPGWGRLLAVVWLLVFALMPLLNQDRLRCGDMVAGTLVVKAPATMLLSDLADRGQPARAVVQRSAAVAPPARPDEEFPFTREQLDIYGVHELQVLEDLLRRDDQGTLDGRILDEVSEKIKLKIGWPRERWQVPPRRFLEAFYRAQRGLLEQKMLFGQRRERKKG
ncbi:MAG TPA: RDD family protein [Thermoanaerobaculia bacterium]|jgi:uncharacterized RDD family membrane protein YckC